MHGKEEQTMKISVLIVTIVAALAMVVMMVGGYPAPETAP